MQRERPLERLLSRLLVVSLLSSSLPLITIARADDSDALEDPSVFETPVPVVQAPSAPSPIPLPAESVAPEPAAAKKQKGGSGVADPIVNASKASDKQTSDTALCDLADGSGQKKPGIGAPVASWPSKDSSKWDAAAKQYMADQRRLSVDNPAFSTLHNSFRGQITGRVDLSSVIAQREEFFQMAFGKKDSNQGWFVEFVCEAKRRMGDQMKEYEAFVKAAKPGAESTCQGSATSDRDLLGRALNNESQYLKTVHSILNGTNEPIGNMKTFGGLEKILYHHAAADTAAVNAVADQNQATHTSVDEGKQLKAENEGLWGKISTASGKIEKPGYFSNVLLQLRTEEKQAKKVVADLTKAHDSAVKQVDSCKSLNPYDYPGKDKATAQPVPKPDITGLDPDGKKKKSDLTDGSQAPVPLPGDGPLNRHQLTDPITDNPVTAAPPPSYASAAANAPDPGPPPAPPEQPNSAVSFLKDNWMWLAGGAVLVGGGLYLYEKNKQDTEQKNFWQDDSNFLPPPPPPGAATVVNGNGVAAAGSKFTFTSGIIAPGGIGQSMGPISVTVTDANNMLQNVNGTAMLSCASPSPCSIGGGTTAIITGGQATFTGVTFSNADQNVLLQVSGAGIANTTAPSTFNVGGSTATNPRY